MSGGISESNPSEIVKFMKSIVLKDRNFQSLPKEIKRLLIVSESMFFEQARTQNHQPPQGRKTKLPSTEPEVVVLTA